MEIERPRVGILCQYRVLRDVLKLLIGCPPVDGDGAAGLFVAVLRHTAATRALSRHFWGLNGWMDATFIKGQERRLNPESLVSMREPVYATQECPRDLRLPPSNNLGVVDGAVRS